MANTIQLKRRIKTAQNVSKTTKAMQMIAASKLKRAQDAALSQRPYVDRIAKLARRLAKKVDDSFKHPYLEANAESDKTLLIVISPDKGLCGGLVTNQIREYLKHMNDENTYVITVGKKIEHVAAKGKNELLASFPIGNTLPRFDAIFPLQTIIDEYVTSGKVKTVNVLFNNFVTVFTQVPTLATLLPVKLDSNTHVLYRETNIKVKVEDKDEDPEETGYTLFEPNPKEMLPILLQRYLEVTLYQYFLESHLSEQAARMLAMQNATDNARDIITQLTLEYNKARQEKITNEILDISSATAATQVTQ